MFTPSFSMHNIIKVRVVISTLALLWILNVTNMNDILVLDETVEVLL